MKKIFLVFLAFTILCGCGAKVMKSIPPIGKVDNEFFEASIIPVKGYRCFNAFVLQVDNKTNSDLQIDWNKTLFINQGQTSGGFMFSGVVYRDRNNPKSPDVIFKGMTFQKQIWPNNLVYFESNAVGWQHGHMSSGKQGIYLTVMTPQGEKSEKIILDILCY